MARGGLVQNINDILSSQNRETLKNIDTTLKIGYSELYAVYRAVLVAPKGSRMCLRIDNTAVQGGLAKGRFTETCMNTLLGLILENLQAEGKILSTEWVDTKRMEQLGADGLSRGKFPEEGQTIAGSMVAKIQAFADKFFGLQFSTIILDAFCSPAQNVCEVQYLSRIVDETDPMSLQLGFFTFNFDELDKPGVVYCFPPPSLEIASIRHILQFKARNYIFILKGSSMTMAMQLAGFQYEYSFQRFAIKGHKKALRARTPSSTLMLLALKPSGGRKRKAD